MSNNIISLLNQVTRNKRQENPFGLDYDQDIIKKIGEKLKSNNTQPNTSSNDAIVEDLLSTNGLVKTIYEHYLFNIIPKSIANELFILNIDIFESKSDIKVLLDKITENFDQILYKGVHQIIVNGGFGLWLVNKAKISDILNKKIIKKENATLEDFIYFDNSAKLKLENKQELEKVKVEDLETIIVHKSRIKPIKILNMFTIGYIISGNLLQDLSRPNSAPSGGNENNVTELFTLFNQLNIKLSQKDKEDIINFVGKNDYIFVPNSDFVYIELEKPYNNGLLANLEWHAKLLSIIRLLLANHAIKFQDLLIVKVDANEIAKPKVGEYLQAALTGLKGRLFTADSNIPITALPNMLSPLQLLFIPTYSGKDAINFEYLTLNFNSDLANVLEQARNDLALDSGIPYPLLVNDQVETNILSQLNGLFYQKIVYIQAQIEKGMKDYIDRILFKVDPETYYAIKDVYSFSLNRPIQAIIQQLSDIISNITNFSINMDNPKALTILQRLLKLVLGEEFVKLFDITEIEFKELIEQKTKEILQQDTKNKEQEENTGLF